MIESKTKQVYTEKSEYSFCCKRSGLSLLMALFLMCLSARAQAQNTTQSHVQNPTPASLYPKMAGYVGIVHPLVTVSEEGTAKNFDRSYTVGMPLGINIWKSPKVGFSLEFVPFIRAENGTSRTNNFLIHPGVLVGLGRGFTFAGRAAFETAGRYGFTPVINKVVVRNKHSSYFVDVPFPVRFGNNHPAAAAVAFQFGIAF